MNNKKKYILSIIAAVVITAVVSSSLTSFVKDNILIYFPSESDGVENKLKAVSTILKQEYLYDFDENQLGEQAIKAYVEGLDEPYTHYYTKEEFSSYMQNIQDGYVGIGVVVGVDENNQIVVIAPSENSPAYNAGIQPGDVITHIDDVKYSGDMINEAVSSIKSGKEGTAVKITVLRNNETIDFEITREDISSESVKGEMIDNEIGYLRITDFNMESSNGQHSTSSEFLDEFTALQNNGMKKLIIDLRDNPGGILDEACNIADMFIPEGTITYTETKDGERNYIYSDSEFTDIPIVILINGNSASASEVFTGALKDYGKATVVGTTSYGKGIVQNVYPFYDGSGISLTSSKYYTPNGICIHEIGIEPDVVVEMPKEYENMYASMIEHEEDVQLQKAVEILKEK